MDGLTEVPIGHRPRGPGTQRALELKPHKIAVLLYRMCKSSVGNSNTACLIQTKQWVGGLWSFIVPNRDTTVGGWVGPGHPLCPG